MNSSHSVFKQFFSFSLQIASSLLYMKRFSKYMSYKMEILLMPLLEAISHIFEISEDDHPPLVTDARVHG
jgi:hypothetical protein